MLVSGSIMDRNLTVILRSCDRVDSASTPSRFRDFGSKSDVMKKCLTSLKKSIEYFELRGNKCKLIIVDDNSSKSMKYFLSSLNPFSLINLDDSGNGPSFVKCVSLACEEDGLVFLLEDDYLLKEECLLSMVDSYYLLSNALQQEVCFHPSDYPDRYKDIRPSIILLGSDRHYRTIQFTTCTFMYHASVFRYFKEDLDSFYSYGKDPTVSENTSVNKVYTKYPCFSPIPSLAEHYHYKDTLSPFFKE